MKKITKILMALALVSSTAAFADAGVKSESCSKAKAFTGFKIGANVGNVFTYNSGVTAGFLKVGALFGYDKAFESGLLVGAELGLDKSLTSGSGFQAPVRAKVGYAFNQNVAAGLTLGGKIPFGGEVKGLKFSPGAFLTTKLSKNVEFGVRYDLTFIGEGKDNFHAVSLGLSYKF